MRDGNIDKFAEIVILFIKKGNGTLKLMPKLFSYRDSDKRNVLHLAAYYGKGVMLMHICAVVKLLILEADGKNSIAGSKIEQKKQKNILLKSLTASKDIVAKGIKGVKQGFDILGNLLRFQFKQINVSLKQQYINLFFDKDIDGNTPLDCACIKGFFQSEDELSTLNLKDMDIIPEIFREIDDGKLKFLEETGKHSLFNKYHDDLKLIKERFELFLNKDIIDKAKTLTDLQLRRRTTSSMASFKDRDDFPRGTKDLTFLSTRAFCINVLIHATASIQHGEKLIIESNYKNRNNPLHWAFYRADLYAAVILMKHNFQMMFWKNEEDECPPHMIFRTKTEKLRNKSIIVIPFPFSKYLCNSNCADSREHPRGNIRVPQAQADQREVPG